MQVSNITKESLAGVTEIQAKLEDGSWPTIATKSLIPTVMQTPSGTAPADRTIQIERDDGAPFTDLRQARMALQEPPVLEVLGNLKFTIKPSVKAAKFIKALHEFTNGELKSINTDQMNNVAQKAGLNGHELVDVLAELLGSKINHHDGGMISLRRDW